MTKVRVCVGMHPEGTYYAVADDALDDKELKYDVLGAWFSEKRDEVSLSFHDLEVNSPQPEPEAKTKFQFGDLVRPSYCNSQYVVAHPHQRAHSREGVSVVLPAYFGKLTKHTNYSEMLNLFGFTQGYSPNCECDGNNTESFALVTKAGQWHINSSGEVILKPKPVVPKPKFKRGDKVTRMQLGKLETWQVVEPKPDADGMIVLLSESFWLGDTSDWPALLTKYGEHGCGSVYRMSYEDDCTLVPEVTAPQSYPGFRVGDMVVDQSNELWDVDEVSVLDTWVTSKNLAGRKKVPTSILKKVVFGTL